MCGVLQAGQSCYNRRTVREIKHSSMTCAGLRGESRSATSDAGLGFRSSISSFGFSSRSSRFEVQAAAEMLGSLLQQQQPAYANSSNSSTSSNHQHCCCSCSRAFSAQPEYVLNFWRPTISMGFLHSFSYAIAKKCHRPRILKLLEKH